MDTYGIRQRDKLPSEMASGGSTSTREELFKHNKFHSWAGDGVAGSTLVICLSQSRSNHASIYGTTRCDIQAHGKMEALSTFGMVPQNTQIYWCKTYIKNKTYKTYNTDFLSILKPCNLYVVLSAPICSLFIANFPYCS